MPVTCFDHFVQDLNPIISWIALELIPEQVEDLVRRWLGEKSIKQSRTKSPEIKWIEDRLEQRLGFNVDVRQTKKGGQIVIHYDSDEDLQSLIDQITGE